MADIFISYARADRERALPIRDRLEEAGLEVFFDAKGIDAGDDFPDVIDHALKSSSVVLGLWSRLALTRPWVRRECRVAQTLGKLVPVALEPLDDSKDIPVEFIGVHYLDLCDVDPVCPSEKWDRVKAALTNRLTVQVLDVSTEDAIAAGPAGSRVFRRPKIYISDCGLPLDTRRDVSSRFVRAGFDMADTVYSGMYLDIVPHYYEQFDIGIIGFGQQATARWRHSLDETQELANHIYVYFEPVAMDRTGYGAPVTGEILHLEDWARRPQACFAELLQCVKGNLIGQGWTVLNGDLPDLELVCRESLGRSVADWTRPLIRAGFRLRDQTGEGLRRMPLDQVGGARVTMFVWGKEATDEDTAVLLRRVRRGTAVVAIAEPGPELPQEIREECNIFDLQREFPSKSVVGTDEWERMLEVLGAAVRASKAMAQTRFIGD